MTRPLIRRPAGPVFGIAMLLAQIPVGCTSPPAPPVTDPESIPGEVDAATSTPTRPPETRPGLVVERWRVREASAELDAAIASIPEVDSAPEVAERWRREGLLVKVVDESSLADLEAVLGPAVFPSRTWHGEATGWRSAARRRLSRGSVMLQDGRVRRPDEGSLAFAVRGWSIPLVDGAALQVELVPHLTAATIDPLAAPIPPGDFRGEALAPPIERSLAPGQALLVATVPDRRRTDIDDEATTETDDETPRPPVDPAADRPPRSTGTGPQAALPPTIGSWLVDDPISGERGVLLLFGRPHPAVDLPVPPVPQDSIEPSEP